MKNQLSDAGIDIFKFSAHSTKSAGDFKAVESEAPSSSILYAGHWSAESTFTRFYHREWATVPSISDMVFNTQEACL